MTTQILAKRINIVQVKLVFEKAPYIKNVIFVLHKMLIS